MDDKKAAKLIRRWRELANAFHADACEAEEERDRYKVTLEALRDDPKTPAWIQTLATGTLVGGSRDD